MNSVALTPATKARSTEMARRVESLGWQQIAVDLDAYGCAMAKGVLLGDECRELAALYRQDAPFRSRIAMSRHGFGRGEYKYWAYPLPETVATLRNTLYPYLAEVANRWNRLMKIEVRYPAQHATYLAQCHQAGQTKPTPLLLQYGEGDFIAPGCVWRPRVSVAGHLLALGSRQGFHRWRVRAHGAAAADTVPRGSGLAGRRRRRDFCGPPASGPRHTRSISGQSPSRRKPHSLWSPAHHGDHFPRRKVSDEPIEMDSFWARSRVPKLKCSRKGRCFSGASP
jgi:hypothetical protein